MAAASPRRSSNAAARSNPAASDDGPQQASGPKASPPSRSVGSSGVAWRGAAPPPLATDGARDAMPPAMSTSRSRARFMGSPMVWPTPIDDTISGAPRIGAPLATYIPTCASIHARRFRSEPTRRPSHAKK